MRKMKIRSLQNVSVMLYRRLIVCYPKIIASLRAATLGNKAYDFQIIDYCYSSLFIKNSNYQPFSSNWCLILPMTRKQEWKLSEFIKTASCHRRHFMVVEKGEFRGAMPFREIRIWFYCDTVNCIHSWRKCLARWGRLEREQRLLCGRAVAMSIVAVSAGTDPRRIDDVDVTGAS